MKIEATAAEWSAALKAVSVVASAADKTVPSLRSVNVVAEAGEVRLEATDRYMLIVRKLKTVTVTGDGSFLLSVDDATRIVKAAAGLGRHLQSYGLELTAEEDQATFVAVATTIHCQQVDGSFPAADKLLDGALERLESSADRASDVSVNPHFLARWAKCCDKHETLQLRATGAGKALVVIGESFIGLQMPVRIPEFTVPDWSTARLRSLRSVKAAA